MAIKELPKFEKTYHLDLEGSFTKQRWSGNFVFKKPNIGDENEIDLLNARLNGDLSSLSSERKYFNNMLATLRYCIKDKESPDWWAKNGYGTQLMDHNVITELYKAFSKFEDDLFQEIWGNQEESVNDGAKV